MYRTDHFVDSSHYGINIRIRYESDGDIGKLAEGGGELMPFERGCTLSDDNEEAST
jgi:hypothetical protein